MKKTLLFLFLTIGIFTYSEQSFFVDIFDKSIEQRSTEPISVTFLNGQLTVVNAPLYSHIEIFSMLGVSIFKNVTNDQKNVYLLDLEKGYYIVKIAKETKKISVK